MSYDPYIIAARYLWQGFAEALLLFWKIVRRPWRVLQTSWQFITRSGDFAEKQE